MDASTAEVAGEGVAATRKQVFAWGLWDWGSSAYHALTLTFVFTVYLTDGVGEDLPGSVSASTWLAWALGASGFLVAVLAPVSGQRYDATGRRKRSLALLTGVSVLAMAAMFFVRDSHGYLWLGLVLLAVASVFAELAQVPFNAMLRQVSTPATVGRVSGFGWAMGYFGGIVLLLICYAGFIAGDGDHRGLFAITNANGFNIRVVMLVAALWFALFALPVLFAVPELPPPHVDPAAGLSGTVRRRGGAGFIESYRVLWRDIRELWDVDRNVVRYLIASALFRDGLAGIFTFGAVLAVNVYGIAEDDVLLFGIAANVVAALGAVAGGRIDDRFGPKAVIMTSLVAMMVLGTVLALISGPTLYWIVALSLVLFIGPAQSSARTFLLRLAPPGREGQLFGLYATTGRAVSFLAPTLFGLTAWAFSSDRAGIVGLLAVVAMGFVAMLMVRRPSD